ncbi:hypothetical protein AVDCRST_MAG82-1792 [uncultured Rubrobacteraceae bacterium]|uniref:Uncharacterized protein n=1 Tax=uncultured Rubrobacteraceae bacterium TaxID=349277 RepID=A0A6J4PWJ3_9ACTN|nr:hypothetical protein AVDCRST_MAG82-1792 [uncultured Rubrobacteraceae bacterium]
MRPYGIDTTDYSRSRPDREDRKHKRLLPSDKMFFVGVK